MYHSALLCFFFILFISVNYISPGFCEGDSLHPAYIYYSNYTLYSSIEYSNYSHHYYIGFKLHVYWDDNEDVITVTGRLWWSYNFCILRLSSASCFARVDSAEIASRSSLTFNNMQFNALWRKSTQVACISPRALIKMSWSLWSLYPSCKSHWLLRAQFTWSSKDTLSDGWRCFHFSGGLSRDSRWCFTPWRGKLYSNLWNRLKEETASPGKNTHGVGDAFSKILLCWIFFVLLV